jgi:hypothetical protein
VPIAFAKLGIEVGEEPIIPALDILDAAFNGRQVGCAASEMPEVSYIIFAIDPLPEPQQEPIVTHVSLDSQDDAVKQFVLGLMIDPSGAVIELNGHPVACVVPSPKTANGSSLPEWNDAKNLRRVELITKKHAEGLSPAGHVELAGLQDEMLRYRQKMAPLPLEDARRLHQDLLARAGGPNSPR